MSSFLNQLSTWEILGLLAVIIIVNTVLFKLLVDWNQSHPVDGPEPAGADSALPSDASFSTSSRGGRPRRRKHLQQEAAAAAGGTEPAAAASTATGGGGDAYPAWPEPMPSGEATAARAPIPLITRSAGGSATGNAKGSEPAAKPDALVSAEAKPPFVSSPEPTPAVTLDLPAMVPNPTTPETIPPLAATASAALGQPAGSNPDLPDVKASIPPAPEVESPMAAPPPPPKPALPSADLVLTPLAPSISPAATPDPVAEMTPTALSTPAEDGSHNKPAPEPGTSSAPPAASGSSAPKPAVSTPVIRRAVGPPRLFLTREFSSLRIRSRPLSSLRSTPELPAESAEATSPVPEPFVPALAEDEADIEPASSLEIPPVPALTPAPEATEPTAEIPAIAEPQPASGSQETPEHDTLSLVAAPVGEGPIPVLPLESTVHAQAAEEESTPATTLEVAPAVPQLVALSNALESAPEPGSAPPRATAQEAAPQEAAPQEAAPQEAAPINVPKAEEFEPFTPAPHAPAVAEEVPAHVATSHEPAPEPESEPVPVPTLDLAPEAGEPVVDIAPEPVIVAPVSASLAESPSHVTPSSAPIPTMATVQPTTGERASAQLTLSFEVSSLQLTPAFKLGSVQLKPLNNVVSLQLGPGAGPQPATNPLTANVSFEILSVQTGSEARIQSLVLRPLPQAQAATTPQPRLQVDAVQLTRGQGQDNAPIQITPAQQTSTAVQVLATYTIAGIDFTPLFEVGSMRLEPSSNTVLLRLSSPQNGGAELPPAFEIASVQVGADGQIALVQLTPTTL